MDLKNYALKCIERILTLRDAKASVCDELRLRVTRVQLLSDGYATALSGRPVARQRLRAAVRVRRPLQMQYMTPSFHLQKGSLGSTPSLSLLPHTVGTLGSFDRKGLLLGQGWPE